MNSYNSEDVIKGIAKGMYDFLNQGTTSANCQATQKVIVEGVRQAMSAESLRPLVQEAIIKALIDYLICKNEEVIAGVERGVFNYLLTRDHQIKDAVILALNAPHCGFGTASGGNSVLSVAIKSACKEFFEKNGSQLRSAIAKSGQTQPVKYTAKTLTLKTAKAFIKSPTKVDLSGFQIIDADAAKKLAKYRGSDLNLNSLRNLSKQVAKALAAAKDCCGLHLDSLTDLSLDAAMELGMFKGGIFLNALTDLSAEVAKELTKTPKRHLHFNSLKELSLDAAKELTKKQPKKNEADPDQHMVFGLELGGLRKPSEQVAEVLARYAGNFKSLSDEMIEALRRHNPEINITGVY